MDVAVDGLGTRMRPNARDHVGVKSEDGRSTPYPQALTCGNGELGSGVGGRSRLEQPPRREHHRDQRGGERLLNQQATNDRTVAMASTPSRPRRRARATSVADQPAPATPVTVQVISPAAVCPATYNAAPVITSAVPASNAALSTRWSSAVVHARGASAGMSGAQMGQPRLSLRGLLTLAYPGERSMWTKGEQALRGFFPSRTARRSALRVVPSLDQPRTQHLAPSTRSFADAPTDSVLSVSGSLHLVLVPRSD
jgi:hypothetical protein